MSLLCVDAKLCVKSEIYFGSHSWLKSKFSKILIIEVTEAPDFQFSTIFT